MIRQPRRTALKFPFLDPRDVYLRSENMILMRVLCAYFLVGIYSTAYGARILGLFVFPSKSHYTIGKEFFMELARRGHEVTMISPFDEKNLPANYRNIKYDMIINKEDKIDFFSKNMHHPFLTMTVLTFMGDKLLSTLLADPSVQKLLHSKEKFDAVIMDQFISDGLSYFAHRFGSNHILISTTCSCSFVAPLVGAPSPPSAVSELLLDFSSDMNFYQRLRNTVFYSFVLFMQHAYAYPSQNKIIQNTFPGSKPLYDYLYNVSLVLLNGHESFCDPVPYVPVMKNVGGFHITQSGKLPDDLQQFMDDAKEGVIYFSMGSNLQSTNLPQKVRDSILRVFSKLKMKILWKWEDDVLPGQPSNLKLSKWFPQKELLAHPNLKIFITHGGLLSTIEAVHYGVPLLTLPVYGDQYTNSARASEKGYAVTLPFHEFEEAKFEAALKELLTQPKYKENAMQKSQIYHDRPMKPMDEAVYWLEYILRHQGAEHLRVASLKLSWYQYLLLDVFAFIFGILFLVILMIKILIKKLFCKSEPVKKIKTN